MNFVDRKEDYQHNKQDIGNKQTSFLCRTYKIDEQGTDQHDYCCVEELCANQEPPFFSINYLLKSVIR